MKITYYFSHYKICKPMEQCYLSWYYSKWTLSLKVYRLSELIFFFSKLPIFDVLYWLQLKFFIISYVNSLERRKYVALDSLVSSKISMLTRAIFIRPDGEIIRESVCAYADLINCLLIEEHVLKLNRGNTRTLTDSTRKQHKKAELASFV
jgi:hypothetical protein